jgi:molybdate transport system substrate-binding protein
MERIVPAALVLALPLLFAQASAVRAAEIKVLCSNGLREVLMQLAPQFEHASGHTLVVRYGLGAKLKQEIESGEPFDLAILPPPALDDLIKQGRVAAGTRTDLARGPIGFMVRAGAAKPDIATIDALKHVLRDAKAIAFAREGVGGVYFVSLAERLGMADEMKAKSRPMANGVMVGEAVQRGEADLGVLPMSEILPLRGAEALGAVPAEVRGHLVMTGGIATGTEQGTAAGELVKFITAPHAVPVLKAKGLEPG